MQTQFRSLFVYSAKHARQLSYVKRGVTCATFFCYIGIKQNWLAINTNGCIATELIMKDLNTIYVLNPNYVMDTYVNLSVR